MVKRSNKILNLRTSRVFRGQTFTKPPPGKRASDFHLEKNIKEAIHTFPWPTKVASKLPCQGHWEETEKQGTSLYFSSRGACVRRGEGAKANPTGKGEPEEQGARGRRAEPAKKPKVSTEGRGGGEGGARRLHEEEGGVPNVAQKSRRPSKVNTHSVSQLRRPRRPPGGAGRSAGDAAASEARRPPSACPGRAARRASLRRTRRAARPALAGGPGSRRALSAHLPAGAKVSVDAPGGAAAVC